MITTLTLSPCIDKTVAVGNFNTGKVNRAESIRLDPGGKGINVSLALAALGVKSRAIVLGFEGGGIIEAALERADIPHSLVPCRGNLRTNLKIFDRSSGKTVELNEQNPEVTADVLGKVTDLCREAARESGILVLSGSIPPGASTDIYRRISIAALEANPAVKILLDTSGEALKEGLKAAPYMMKPNVEELEQCFGVSLQSNADVIKLCRKIIADYGVSVALVSMGSNGALAVTRNEAVRADALKIIPKSAQGAGDAMVAGACLAISQGLPLAEVIRYGTCAAAGAVELEGTAFCSRERFNELISLI